MKSVESQLSNEVNDWSRRLTTTAPWETWTPEQKLHEEYDLWTSEHQRGHEFWTCVGCIYGRAQSHPFGTRRRM